MAFFPSIDNCVEITLTTNIQLDYPYSANLANVTAANMMDVTASIGGLNVFLPDATQTTPGFSISFNNVGANSFNIVLNDRVTCQHFSGQYVQAHFCISSYFTGDR